MRNLMDLITTIVIWFLFALAGLCIFLLLFFIGDAILNGFDVVQECKVSP